MSQKSLPKYAITALLLLLYRSVSASGEGSFCAQSGMCLGLGIGTAHFAHSEWDCARGCNTTAGCEWYSYDPDDKLCATLSTCPSLDAVSCPDCVSGERGCSVSVCFAEGECSGGEYAGKLKGVASADDCLKQCRENTLCKWFTFYPNTETCLFYGSCSEVKQGCQNCVTGQEECSHSQGKEK